MLWAMGFSILKKNIREAIDLKQHLDEPNYENKLNYRVRPRKIYYIYLSSNFMIELFFSCANT